MRRKAKFLIVFEMFFALPLPRSSGNRSALPYIAAEHRVNLYELSMLYIVCCI